MQGTRINFKGVLAYEGRHYFGFQKTNMGPSIEETLLKVVERIVQEPVKINAASRTDRGVHAKGQVFHFYSETQIPVQKLLYAINGLLPKDIRLLSLEIAPPSFHPTLDAKKKEYLYTIDRGANSNPFTRFTSWHYPHPLDLEKMREGAKNFVGTKDFAAFQNASKKKGDSIRTIESISFEEKGDELVIQIIGTSFLYKMVRNIVGTLVYIGHGKLELSDVAPILEQKLRKNAALSAPAVGLTLNRVYY